MKFSYLSTTILFLALFLSACSANKPTQAKKIEQVKHNDTRVLDLSTIQPLDTIAGAIKKNRVILVGETHTNYSHHLNQFAVIKTAHKMWGENTSIGLEMVQKPYQNYLDDYVSGRISESQMLRGIEWYKRWRYDFRLYRPIFNYAKLNQIPLIALNIPQELTKRISKVGITGLNQSERSQLPKRLDKSNPEYQARLKKVFGMHAYGGVNSNRGFDKFLDAQLAWDEGMAFNASNYLKKHTKKKMVILAGSGHLINREGIPSRLDRQLGIRSLVLLNDAGDNPSSKQADYLLLSSEKKLPPAGLIGISMLPNTIGVKVGLVSPNGAAHKAGLIKGDIITALNQQTVNSLSDVSLWRLDKKPGDLVSVKILRNNKTLIKPLKLGSAKH